MTVSRLFWAAVGAAGGIAAYRKWEQVKDRARDEGIVPTAQAMITSTLATVETARGLIGRPGNTSATGSAR